MVAADPLCEPDGGQQRPKIIEADVCVSRPPKDLVENPLAH
jgi:hypothetical protein